MNRTSRIAPLALTFGATFTTAYAGDNPVLAAAASTTVSPAQCARSTSLTYVQRQVVDKASQGVRPLVQYINRTRMIHQLDVRSTVEWLDQRRELLEACENQRVARLGE
jgi:hypothetical protein